MPITLPLAPWLNTTTRSKVTAGPERQLRLMLAVAVTGGGLVAVAVAVAEAEAVAAEFVAIGRGFCDWLATIVWATKVATAFSNDLVAAKDVATASFILDGCPKVGKQADMVITKHKTNANIYFITFSFFDTKIMLMVL
ncbi:MAG: hypothetical protein NTV38_02775 [Chloroflexi bacterium]|nr:hypothetical protein [Chloroflexota bacterium]